MAIVFSMGRVYAVGQLRNCSSQWSLVRRYSSHMSSVTRLHTKSILAMVTSTTATTFVNPIISKQKAAAFNYSPSYYHSDHIRKSLYSLGMASRAFSATRLKTIDVIDKESAGDTSIDDDYSNNGQRRYVDEKKWPEVFCKALEREGVTHIMADRNRCGCVKTVLYNQFKSIDCNNLHGKISNLYMATGFAAADRGEKDRLGVCMTTANSGILAYDALVKCHQVGENLPVVCIIGPVDKGFPDCLQFNDEPLVSLPHYYRILDVRDITTVVQQAFSSAYKEGGPVFIDIQHLPVDDDDDGNKEESCFDAEGMVRFIEEEAMSCTMYVSSSWHVGGVDNANNSELSRFVELTGIPVTRSLVGLADLNHVVLYLGATSKDLPAIVAMDKEVLVFPVDVGDDEITKIIKNPIHIPTLKEMNEMFERMEERSCWSGWAQEFFEKQWKLEDTLTSCYADIFTSTELEADNKNNRMTREVAIQVLDEFFEANKEDIIVFRDCDSWLIGNGAVYATEKHVFLVSDGFDDIDSRANYNFPCKIILDNTGWTKRFYHETQKMSTLVTDYEWHGEVVMNKSALKDALYDRLSKETCSHEGNFLVVALAPPDHREIVPNFRRDIRFVQYPTAYAYDLVDKELLA